MKSPILSLALLATSVAAVPVGDAPARGFETMGAFSSEMSKRQSFSVEENQLGLCRPVLVIFARGTIELGNVGSLAGPPFFNALDFAIGAQNVGIQGVPYPASIWGYLSGGDVNGGKTLAALTEQAMAQCPESQIVLSGYSQGAQVVHLGVQRLPAAIASKVAAVVLFGDPFDGQPLPNIDASKVKTFCFEDDLICRDLAVVDAFHLAYGVDAVPAAEFVQSKVHV